MDFETSEGENSLGDFPADTDTPARLAAGDTLRGEISSANDTDFVAIHLEAGVRYQIDFQGSSGVFGLGDPLITDILDADGASLGLRNDDGGPGLFSRVTFTPSESGTFFLVLDGFAQRTGDYIVTLEEVIPNTLLVGDDENNSLAGDALGNTLFGDAGADTLSGGAGDDSLYGSDGADLLLGGSGDDILLVDTGNDTLEGGAGADVFFIEARDAEIVIRDFNPGEGDILDLTPQFNLQFFSQVDAASSVQGGDLVIDLLDGGRVILEGGADLSLSPSDLSLYGGRRAIDFFEPTGLSEEVASIVSALRYTPPESGAPLVLTYSFPQNGADFSDYDGVDDDIDFPSQFQPATPIFVAAARETFRQLSDIANIVFIEVDEDEGFIGDIRIARSGLVDDEGAAGIAFFPNEGVGSDVWLSVDIPFSPGIIFNLVAHEIGHAIGLAHTVDSDFIESVSRPDLNGVEFTIMATVLAQLASRGSGVFPNESLDGYQSLDIQAIQFSYGANPVANVGDDVYTFSSGELYWGGLADAGGTDTIVVSGSRSADIDLGAVNQNVGQSVQLSNFSRISDTLQLPPSTVIENVTTGNASDTVRGNDVANLIDAGGGNDFITGGAGSDTLLGGTGNDEIFAGSGDDMGDWVDGGTGNDILGVAAGNDTAFGAGGADTLFGGAGDDILVGSDFVDGNGDGLYQDGEFDTSSLASDVIYAGVGDDTLQAAAGDDELGGGTGDDVISAAAGDDTVYGGGGDGAAAGLNDSIDLGDGDDQAFASGGNDSVVGGDGADLVFGGGGDDSLQGGDGGDTIWGGGGDDVLTGGQGADIFAFAAGHGDDTITDFAGDEDSLLFEGVFADLAALQLAASSVAGGVLITTGDQSSILIEGLSLAELMVADVDLSG